MDTFTFVGIEINRKAPHFTFIAIDEMAVPLAIDTGTIENILSYLSGLQKARVSINAPLSLNKNFIKHAGHKKSTPGKLPNMRNVEYELEEHGIPMYHTPDRIPKNDPVIQYGLALADYLPQMGYQNTIASTEGNHFTFFESPANAAFWSLIDAKLLDENTLMGRVQRQLILHDLHLPVENAMNFFEELTRFKIKHGTIPYELILPPQELNAWMEAYMARESYQNESAIIHLGVPQEGLVYLPAYPDRLSHSTTGIQASLFNGV